MAETSWMNEASIIATSFPYVRVLLGADKQWSIPYNQLKNVSVEGKTNMSRKGTIQFVDAIGEWPDILMKIGADSNAVRNVRKPNIFVTFGWKKLRGNYECLRSLDGMVIKSSIDLTDDGQVMISLEYIETVMSVTGTLRYLDPNDIQIIYNEKENGTFKNMTVAEKLTWLTDWDKNATSVAQELKRQKIKYSFESTFDDKGVEIEIGFGDYLSNVINELTAKAEHQKVDRQNFSYERGITYTGKYNGIDGFNFLPYVWKAAPADDNVEPEKLLDKMTEGPTLVYKKTAAAGEKQILSFTSDLNSKTGLMFQSQDEINKKLMSFTEEDMEMINKTIREGGMDALRKKDSAGFLCFGLNQKEADARNRIKSEAVKVVAASKGETKSSQNSQLEAILAQNVFKSTIKIMGDPTFGTDYEPWKFKMKTNFNAVGGFGKVFGSRVWALTYTKHVFSEGSYETEMEMLAYPEPPANIFPEYKSQYDVMKMQEEKESKK